MSKNAPYNCKENENKTRYKFKAFSLRRLPRKTKRKIKEIDKRKKALIGGVEPTWTEDNFGYLIKPAN